MIQICCYKGCGFVYGEKEPLSDKRVTHGICPKHLQLSLNALKAAAEKNPMINNMNKSHPRPDWEISSGQDAQPQQSGYGGSKYY